MSPIVGRKCEIISTHQIGYIVGEVDNDGYVAVLNKHGHIDLWSIELVKIVDMEGFKFDEN